MGTYLERVSCGCETSAATARDDSHWVLSALALTIPFHDILYSDALLCRCCFLVRTQLGCASFMLFVLCRLCVCRRYRLGKVSPQLMLV
jgi:hypothetical protein